MTKIREDDDERPIEVCKKVEDELIIGGMPKDCSATIKVGKLTNGKYVQAFSLYVGPADKGISTPLNSSRGTYANKDKAVHQAFVLMCKLIHDWLGQQPATLEGCLAAVGRRYQRIFYERISGVRMNANESPDEDEEAEELSPADQEELFGGDAEPAAALEAEEDEEAPTPEPETPPASPAPKPKKKKGQKPAAADECPSPTDEEMEQLLGEDDFDL